MKTYASLRALLFVGANAKTDAVHSPYLYSLGGLSMVTIDRTKYYFVGVDLHKKNHVAVLCSCFGDVIRKYKINNSPAQFEQFLHDIRKHAEGKGLIFGLEDVNFYGRTLSKFLIQNGCLVKEVNSS